VTEDTLGQRIRQLRQERGMSLAKVAGGDFSRAFLNQVELGKSQPSTRVLRVIANRLGAPVEYLLEGSTPSLDRQVAVERARVDVARARFREALATIEPALDSAEWPLGVDARLCAAEALIGLDRWAEADRLLTDVEKVVRARGDTYRAKRVRALRTGRVPLGADTADPKALGDAHVRLAEQRLRAGDHAGALEHFRTGRILLEAVAPRGRKETYTSAAGRRSAE
jgi:transcriptional regulator with XRE-family HTH domain